MRIPIRWRADGMAPLQIAKTLERPLSTVRWALDKNRDRAEPSMMIMAARHPNLFDGDV